MEYLKDGERIDDLQRGGLSIIQHPRLFRFGTDSVLLADFARVRRGERAVDLCCGCGAVALLMLAREPSARCVGVEIQPEIADMARRSALINGLEGRFCVHEGDVRAAGAALGLGKFSLAVCNPPYHKDGAALLSADERMRVARHEGTLAPPDLARAAAALLKNGGRFAAVYPAPRALELLRAMEDAGIEPKRVRTVHGVAGRPPKLVLVDGVRGAGAGLHWMEPLVLRGADGEQTPECRRIYGETE